MRRLAAAILLAGAAMRLGACHYVAPPTEDELGRIAAGKETFVFFRLQCSIEGEPRAVFRPPEWTDDPVVSIKLGSFETVGQPVCTSVRFLSEESRDAGWAYLLLEPGTYYLEVDGAGPYSVEGSLARWRMDVPSGLQALYVGSIEVRWYVEERYLFGAPTLKEVPPIDLPTRDESGEATRLLSDVLPTLGTPASVPLRRWHSGDPVVIRSTPPAMPSTGR